MSYYNCKVTFTAGEITKKGKPIVTKYEILVEALSVAEAEVVIANHLRDTINDYEVTGITKSKIESVVKSDQR